MTSELSLTAIGTWSEAKYTNNPDAVLTYESENESNLDRVYAKGMRANGTPLSAYSLALDYNVKGWFFNLTGNYYDRVYIDFSSYRRLGSVLDKNGAGVDANGNPGSQCTGSGETGWRIYVGCFYWKIYPFAQWKEH